MSVITTSDPQLLIAQTLITETQLAHVAIIMDGNRRWAEAKKQPTMMGHQQGVKSLKKLLRFASDAGLKAMTVYAFSTENWQRSVEEVGFLMGLFVQALSAEINELHQNRVKIRFIGDLSILPENLRQEIDKAHHLTENNTGICFQVATNYGSRAELVKATKAIAEQVASGALKTEDITEQHLEKELYTHGLPDLDLLIRTGGEYRLSNYLLWQAAYAEILITETLWPDFTPEVFIEAIENYQARHRRFGQ